MIPIPVSRRFARTLSAGAPASIPQNDTTSEKSTVAQDPQLAPPCPQAYFWFGITEGRAHMKSVNKLILLGFMISFLAVSAVFAASNGAPIAEREWRALTEGKTVYYSIAGEFYGREYYLPGSDQVFFQHRDGTCMRGVWSYDEPWYSFTFTLEGYQLPPHRFLHQRIGNRILIISYDPDQPRQQVDRIVYAPFTCDADVTS
jgi:hypothetical protein